MADFIRLDYEGAAVGFDEAAWFNATAAVERFGKRIDHWLENQETREYIEALCHVLNTRNSGDLIRTKRGKNGGTWLHPKLAVVFARWLDTRFAVWCDLQIDGLLRGTHTHYDRRRARDAAASSFKVMAEVLQMARQEQGKATGRHHYINETRLVNWALSGEFKALDRETLAPWGLALLASLEERNAVLLARGVEYADRKKMLEQHAIDYRTVHRLANATFQTPIRAKVEAFPGRTL
jgi:hypothetical protein